MQFEIGKEYKRRTEIHGAFGGQSQGGISTPKAHPFVLLFTSDAGEQHGYRDEYREDGIFWYTGEGQTGDMKMIAGNKAILDHTQKGKTLHLFEYVRKGVVRYMGSAECLGYHEETRPDREGNDRTAFIFHLDVDSVPSSKASPAIAGPELDVENLKALKKKSLADLRKAAIAKPTRTQSKKQRHYSAYIRAQAIKLYALKRAEGVCEGCGEDAPFNSKRGPYLECHHVHRLTDGGPDHPSNVVAICPNCHRRAHYSKDATVFNQGLIEVAKRKEADLADHH